MSKGDSTVPASADKSVKPSKPYAEFPLFPHPTSRWAQKIRGTMHDFGAWSDPDAALGKYLKQKDAQHAGHKPRPSPIPATVKDVVNAFLNHKQGLLDAGELAPTPTPIYKVASDTLVNHIGKRRIVADRDPQDFAILRGKMAEKWGPYRLADTTQHIYFVFEHAFDAGLIPTPVRFDPDFKGPTKKTLRLHRAKQGAKLFTADEVRRIHDAAGPTMSNRSRRKNTCPVYRNQAGTSDFQLKYADCR